MRTVASVLREAAITVLAIAAAIVVVGILLVEIGVL
jgi:hypothetical protein